MYISLLRGTGCEPSVAVEVPAKSLWYEGMNSIGALFDFLSIDPVEN